MFRVQENEDGTTSVFCNASGKHIFTLRHNQQPRIPERTTVNRPINVVGPSRQTGSSSRTQSHISDDESALKQDTTPDQDLDINTSDAKCLLSPIPFCFDDVTEDYFNHSATQDEFARCINLVPKQRFQSEPLEEISKEFPLRLLSRSKAFRSTENSFEDLHYQKLPDDMPLSSNLGMKWLKLNESRNFMNEHKLSIGIKKYDTFCRFPFNTPNPSECNFPKLRCREKKAYPTLFGSKAGKHEATHFYTYGRRQRLERMRTLKTGLDKESRRLLRMCNAKQYSVVLKRLDDAEIKYWREKKSEPIVIVIDDDSDDGFAYSSKMPSNTDSFRSSEMPSKNVIREGDTNISNCLQPMNHHQATTSHNQNENVVQQKSIACSNRVATDVLRSLFTSSSSGLVDLPGARKKPSTYKFQAWSHVSKLEDKKLAKRKGCKRCYVRLVDVSKLVQKFQDDYYVKWTNIRVPFYLNHLVSTTLASCSKGTPNSSKTYRQRSLSTSHSSYKIQGDNTPNKHFTKSSIMNVTPVNSQRKVPSRALVPVSQCRSSSAPLDAESSSRNALKIIPYIDLTEDSPPPPEPDPNQYLVPKRFFVTQWLFRCFGCGFKRLFTDEASRFTASNVVNSAISDHMRTFHTVDKPEAFLTSYLDSFNNRSIIEAFPGYKEN